MIDPWNMPNPVMRISTERERLAEAEQALANPGLPTSERAMWETLKAHSEAQIERWEQIIKTIRGAPCPDAPQPPAIAPAPASAAPRRVRKPKAQPAPTAWRCAECGASGQRSLKNAAYCTACAKYQPIGTTA